MMEKIATIQARTITHSLIGGYDSNPYSLALDLAELPRAQAIKGTLRWWFRALVGGAEWMKGNRNRDRLLTSVRERTTKVLGSLKGVSKVILRVKLSEEEWKILKLEPSQLESLEEEKRKRLGDIIPTLGGRGKFPHPLLPPRLRILKEGKEREEAAARIACYNPGCSFTVELIERPGSNLSDEEKRIISWSSVFALILGGIGAITRRGFGALRIEHFDGYPEIEGKIQEFNKGNEGALFEMIKQALSDLGAPAESERTEELPPFAILTQPSEGPFRLKVCKVRTKDTVSASLRDIFEDGAHSMALLLMLGYVTNKCAWKIAEREDERALGRRYDTWIMGLPRQGKMEIKIKRKKFKETFDTGYIFDQKTLRRTSAISLRPIFQDPKDPSSWKVAVLGFLSEDWPSKLQYRRGVNPHKIRRDPMNALKEARRIEPQTIDVRQKLRASFNNAWELVNRMLEEE